MSDTAHRAAGHGTPYRRNCTVPGCHRQGHKCLSETCSDPVHTHPHDEVLILREIREQGGGRVS